MASLISQIIIISLSLTIILLAAWGLIFPNRLTAWVLAFMERRSGLYVAVIVRVVLGSALIIAADASRFALAFTILGWLMLFAAFVLLLLGHERLQRLLRWWATRVSRATTRMWLLLGIFFAAFLCFGVLAPAL